MFDLEYFDAGDYGMSIVCAAFLTAFLTLGVSSFIEAEYMDKIIVEKKLMIYAPDDKFPVRVLTSSNGDYYSYFVFTKDAYETQKRSTAYTKIKKANEDKP